MKISPKAVEALQKMLDSEAAYIAKNDYIPVIAWCFNRKGTSSDPGPALGLMERRKVKRMRLCDCAGLEIYDCLPAELSERYAESMLDVFDGNINFRE